VDLREANGVQVGDHNTGDGAAWVNAAQDKAVQVGSGNSFPVHAEVAASRSRWRMI
jgi:hypothetical protein